MKGIKRVSMRFDSTALLVIASILISACTKTKIQTPPQIEPNVPKNINYGEDIYEPDRSFKVVGYLTIPSVGNGREYMDNFDFSRITYLNLSFLNPNAEGDLVGLNDFDIEYAVKNVHEQDVKVFISLAGGLLDQSTLGYWNKYLQPSNRASFVRKIAEFVVDNNIDGVDVDIENTLLKVVGDLYEPFVVELREALHSYGKGITAAMYPTSLHKAVTDRAIEAFDFINVMVYNLRGLWNLNNPGPHSPYSFVNDAYIFWNARKGVSQDKLVLGIPFYGWDFIRKKSWRYSEIVSMDPDNAYSDNVEQIYYNGIPTIMKKIGFAKRSFSGVMFWQLRQDTTDELSLLTAVDQTIKLTGCDGTLFWRDEDADGLGNPSMPIISCAPPVGYVENRRDRNDKVFNEVEILRNTFEWSTIP